MTDAANDKTNEPRGIAKLLLGISAKKPKAVVVDDEVMYLDEEWVEEGVRDAEEEAQRE